MTSSGVHRRRWLASEARDKAFGLRRPGPDLAGIILAEAGMRRPPGGSDAELRPRSSRGASKSEVVISSEAIDYPKVTSPDVVLVMSDVACQRYACTVQQGGTLIVDSGLVKDVPPAPGQLYSVPITDVAKQATGRAITANIVALGVVNTIAGIVSPEALEKAVLSRVPKGTEELNLKALRAGIEAAKAAM